MTEQEAQDWVAKTFGEAAKDGLQHLADMVIAESPQQNLIAPSTLDAMSIAISSTQHN